MVKYKFVGEGMGVPGLPHEISAEEAESLGVSELLKAAIENGSYTPLLSSTTTSPQIEDHDLGGDDAKE